VVESPKNRFRSWLLKTCWILTFQWLCTRIFSCSWIISSQSSQNTIDKLSYRRKKMSSARMQNRLHKKGAPQQKNIWKMWAISLFSVHPVILSKTKLASCWCLWLARNPLLLNYSQMRCCRSTFRSINSMTNRMKESRLLMTLITLWAAIESYSKEYRQAKYNLIQTHKAQFKVLLMMKMNP